VTFVIERFARRGTVRRTWWRDEVKRPARSRSCFDSPRIVSPPPACSTASLRAGFAEE
jgi:hypothetical protein